MPTREQNRLDLYNVIKDNIEFPQKTQGGQIKYYTLKELEQFNSPEKMFLLFKNIFFRNIERVPNLGPVNGTLDLHKIVTEKIKDPDGKFNDVNYFFLYYACDLPYCKDTPYCHTKAREMKEYTGTYDIYKYEEVPSEEGKKIIDTAKIVILDDKLNLYFTKNPKSYDLERVKTLYDTFEAKTTKSLYNDNEVSIKVATVEFFEDEDDKTIFQFDFKGIGGNLTGLNYTGIRQFYWNTEDDEPVDPPKPDPPKPDPPKPNPPKPNDGINCTTSSFPWGINCKNDYIRVLNNMYGLSQNGDKLTKDLLIKLDSATYIKLENNGISRSEMQLIMKDHTKEFSGLDPINENKKDSLKKVIKESTSRILKDIYYRA